MRQAVPKSASLAPYLRHDRITSLPTTSTMSWSKVRVFDVPTFARSVGNAWPPSKTRPGFGRTAGLAVPIPRLRSTLDRSLEGPV